jgi:hypothetical protein
MINVHRYQRDFQTDSIVGFAANLSTTFICPSPTVADATRSRLSSVANYDKLMVTTVSSFIAGESKKNCPNLKLYNKSQMLLLLRRVANKYFENLSHDVFIRSFDLFSDLRSYTLDLTLLMEILEEFGEEVSSLVKLFFWEVDKTGTIADEHLIYHRLADSYREPSTLEQANIRSSQPVRNYLFYGFSHLSAIQVDYIRALGIRDNVYVLLPDEIYRSGRTTDWMTWLSDEESDLTAGVSSDYELYRVNCQLVRFSPGNLGSTLKELYLQQDQDDSSGSSIFMTELDLDFNRVNTLPLPELSFKVPCDIFFTELEQVSDYFTESWFANRSTVHDSKEMLTRIDHYVKCEIERKECNYRRIKVALLLHTAIVEFLSYGDSEGKVNFCHADFKLLIMSVALRLPRISSISMGDGEEGTIFVRSIRDIEAVKPEGKCWAVASSDSSRLSSGGNSSYPRAVLSFLATIGPVRRPALQQDFLRYHLLNLLNSRDSTLILESGIELEDSWWSEVLDRLEPQVGLATPSPCSKDRQSEVIEKKRDHLAKKMDTSIVSRKWTTPSSLQSYLECPRKYYFSFLNQIAPRLDINHILLPYQLGEIEHSIIERYFCRVAKYSHEEHLEVAESTLKEYLKKENLDLSLVDYESALVESLHYSGNGIKLLFNLIEFLPGATIDFESQLDCSNLMVRGRVDAIIRCGEGFGIIDFKRSSSSIPSGREINDFKKIQLPFYLLRLMESRGGAPLFMGYLNLSATEQSRFITFSEKGYNVLDSIDGLDSKAVTRYTSDVATLLSSYRQFEHQALERISNDKDYLPIPSPEACRYCPVQMICGREK